MIKEFNRPNHSSIINQDLIAFKKVLKWASNIHKRLFKNINEIKSNQIDDKYQNEFTKLNECQKTTPHQRAKYKTKIKNIQIQKNQTLNKLTDKSKFQLLSINMPTPDSSSSQSDKTITPSLNREINQESQNSLEDVCIEISRIQDLSKKSQSNHQDQMEILTALLLKVNNR
ncbi:unnamed protein product [Brachionus calyciflorus]|uniref:Uncharacterized protein n=1 Tax=Brachionus calyciflorus TaxID=104777 RepID=A0A814NDJ0_9BILA|nr:unnamed protein product [Brachionus calyciflorus]